MKCKEYVFKLTSGQLDEAPLGERMQARMHRLACKACRAFTHNDQKLGTVLADYKKHLTEQDQPDR